MLSNLYDVFLRILPIIWAVAIAWVSFLLLLGDSDSSRRIKNILVYCAAGSLDLVLAPKVVGLVYGIESISSVLPILLPVLILLIAAVGVVLPVAMHIAKRRDYSQYSEALQDEKNAIPISFPVFEGAYSRNPEVWNRQEQCVERDGQICVFSYSDFKRYTRFLRRMERAEEERKEAEKKAKEILAIREQRSLFEKDPAEYLKLPEPEIAISFPEVQEEYDALLADVADYREKQLQNCIIMDYNSARNEHL